MKLILLATTFGALLAGLPVQANAQSDGSVFLCVDAQGRKEYKNTGITKGCKKVELPTITTIPAPKRSAPSADRAPERGVGANAGGDFPKVDNATQKARDSDRKQILQDELRTESQKLAALKKDFNNGEPERRGDEANYAKYQDRVAQMKDDIGRVQQNVDALKRELGNQK